MLMKYVNAYLFVFLFICGVNNQIVNLYFKGLLTYFSANK